MEIDFGFLFSILMTWIFLGALTGWISSIMMGQKTGQRSNIVAGIMGGFLGGLLSSFLDFGNTVLTSIGAILGAILFLFVVGGLRPKSREIPKTSAQEAKSSDSASVQPKKKTIIPSAPSVSKPDASTIEPQKETESVSKSPAGKSEVGVIFVSYRRSDTAHVAGRIYDRLVVDFGRVSVFKDVDSIPLGLDFKEYLDEKVGECKVLLAIIGDRWLDERDTTGKRRLDDPTDFVRIEIESALTRRIPVIPLLVGGASMPREEELPVSLRKLVYRNGIAIRPDPDFHRDVDRLISALKTYV